MHLTVLSMQLIVSISPTEYREIFNISIDLEYNAMYVLSSLLELFLCYERTT